MKTRRIEFGDFPFITFSNARRGVYNDHRRRLMALQGDITLSEEEKEAQREQLQKQYRSELIRLLKQHDMPIQGEN